MGKKKLKKNKSINNNLINITNFKKDDSFFFDVTKIFPCIQSIKNKSELMIYEDEISPLKNKINEIRANLNSNRTKYKEINILDEFKEHLDKMEIFDSKKSIYASQINSIINSERAKNNKVITLAKIRKAYLDKYKKEISITTISRIMKRHLGLRFKKVSLKNAKLEKKNYKIMKIIFLKTILRAINQNLELIYIDETSCALQNNNYKDWIGPKEEILKGPEKEGKEKLNIIMAINTKRIIYYEIISSNVNSFSFGEFIENLFQKLTPEERVNSLLIFDNATCHKTSDNVEKLTKKKFKAITNIPYKSNYNGIEFCFAYFKNEYYKYILKNKTEQKKKIIEIFESKELKENIPSFYLQAYENYSRDIINEIKEGKIGKIITNINSDEEDDLSKSFDE